MALQGAVAAVQPESAGPHDHNKDDYIGLDKDRQSKFGAVPTSILTAQPEPSKNRGQEYGDRQQPAVAVLVAPRLFLL
jgi:hypothetical protein